MMVERVAGFIPAVLIVWTLLFGMAQPGEHNWWLWLQTSQAYEWYRTGWLIFMIAVAGLTIGICLMFLGKRPLVFILSVVGVYLAVNAYGIGMKAMGDPLILEEVATLVTANIAVGAGLFPEFVFGRRLTMNKSSSVMVHGEGGEQ